MRAPTESADPFDDAVASPHLREPRSILDLVNYQMYLIGSMNSADVTRMCEGEFGITRREWRFLALLAALGPLAPSELAVRAGLDRSRTSKGVTALLAKDLITKLTFPSDRRRSTVDLTEDGRALYERIFPRVRAVNVALLGVLDDAETSTLTSILDKLRRQATALSHGDRTVGLAPRRRGGSRLTWDRVTLSHVPGTKGT